MTTGEKSRHNSALILSMQFQGKAHATCVKVYTILHSLFKMAYMADVVTSNLMDKVERPKLCKGKSKDRDVEALIPTSCATPSSALRHHQRR